MSVQIARVSGGSGKAKGCCCIACLRTTTMTRLIVNPETLMPTNQCKGKGTLMKQSPALRRSSNG